MVKSKEIEEVLAMKSRFHFCLMIYTAGMVPLTGFLTAVLRAIGFCGCGADQEDAAAPREGRRSRAGSGRVLLMDLFYPVSLWR